jgi:GDP-4-dehydro-6-deoxy-D-mannose reductase
LKALITGIAGFAGSYLAEHLLEHPGLEVCGLIHKSEGHIAPLGHRLTLLRGDVCDLKSVSDILISTKPDYVFHLAGQPFVPDSWRDPWDTFELNVRGQLNILRTAIQTVPQARILVIGSNEEYGLVSPEDLPIDENTALRPYNPYGVSKLAQDMLGLQYYLSHKLHTVRVRPFNHIGPRQSERFVTAAFAKQIAEIEMGLKPPVVKVGNLKVKRDFTDVRDVGRAYYLALTTGQSGQVYNIGSGQARGIQELLDHLLSLSQVEVTVEQDASRLRPSDIPIVLCDATRFREQTGWQPTIPFEQSLQDTLDYWRAKAQDKVQGAK